MPHSEYVVPPDEEDDDENNSAAFTRPVYPRITRAQWAVLVAMTDKNCTDLIEGAAFYSQLSKSAKDFLKAADDEKIETLNSNLTFYANSRIIWKFLWVGGATAFGLFIGITQLWKAFGEFFTVKIK